jgi:hypothetical protein
MVRVAKFCPCAAAATPVVMSALVVIVQAWELASRSALATVKATAASLSPLFATAAVKVLVPQLLSLGALPAASVQSGSTIMIVSPTARTLLHLNVNETALAAPAMVDVRVSSVLEKAATAVAGEAMIVAGVGLMAPAIVALMVRVAKFCACAAGATPAAVVIVQRVVFASSGLVATVKVTAASLSPLFATAAVKVLVPHVPNAAMPATSVQWGSTMTIVSPTARTLVHLNANEMLLAAPAMALTGTRVRASAV